LLRRPGIAGRPDSAGATLASDRSFAAQPQSMVSIILVNDGNTHHDSDSEPGLIQPKTSKTKAFAHISKLMGIKHPAIL
jgi:hypothetical protein